MNNVTVDCPISVKFGTKFDYVTPVVLQTLRSSVKRQGHSVITSSDRQIIAPF